MEAAAWLGHKKTDVPTIPIWWLYKAINYMSAEAEGEKDKADRIASNGYYRR